MAGGIDWFRWHHGSVTDPKFGLVAKKAGARLGDVLAVWAFVLESASSNEDRGLIGPVDFESLDYLLSLEAGGATRILDAMSQRGLLGSQGRVASWDKRQPKRERPEDKSAERTRAYRERRASGDATENQVTPSDATERQETPRGEKSREEEKKYLPGFALFWSAWPTSDRKQAKGKCHDAWKKAGAEPHAALVVAHVERSKAGPWAKDGGKFIPAPLTYLNQRRWEGADDASNDDPYGLKNAINAEHIR